MKPTIIIVFLLIYAFVDLPLEITDSFLAYLIPFIISIVGLGLCILNFQFIKTVGRHKKIVHVSNFLTVIVFSFLMIYNFPIPERSGLRCKNWTDISMLINPIDKSEQYIFQSLEISGSIYSHRQVRVRPINSWLRWNHIIKSSPQFGNWLYIDNSKDGENAVPFPLDNSKICFETDSAKAVIVTLENGQIKNINL
ncbi:MAG: hypothetical protein IPO21_02780 [Bacteroidales bacterium]|nr:hypothetical protein [Bacteroidales bacterium]